MANNVFQVKRTNVSGRTPNTTGSYGTNSQYIAAGEFALNMADGILYTSNGSAVITVGANLVNQSITGNLTVKAIIANGSIGVAGQTLTSNGSAVYWATGAGSGTVTQVNTGNGMTGGPITTTGTVSILANTGIVANATGTYVNATYIGTISSNNASFLGGVAAASYVQNTDSRTLSGNLVISGTYFNPSSNTILLGNSTQRWALSANTGSFSGAVSGITTLAAGNTTITGFINVSSTSVLTGNVAIGTTNTSAYALNVNGSFAATTKSFVIDHPTKEGQKLRYASLEGPENGVYVRGKLEGKSIIELPDYWWNLIDESTITVNLTPIGRSQDLWVQSTSAYFIHLNQPADCFFTVFAERKDVDKLVVEY